MDPNWPFSIVESTYVTPNILANQIFLKTLAWREHLGNFSWRGVKIQFVLFGVTSDLLHYTLFDIFSQISAKLEIIPK
jgi:uncharacterized membrane protein YkvI